MKILIYGTDCPKCRKMEEVVRRMLAELGQPTDIEKITDMREIMEAGVMYTPALSIDGKVVVTGRVPSRDELQDLMTS
jgi:small redox-active disulfide protein 2